MFSTLAVTCTLYGVIERDSFPATGAINTTIEMVTVYGGNFELGRELGTAGFGDITPVSQVSLSVYRIGRYPVTQAQYGAVMGYNPSHFHGGSGREPAAGEVQGRRPVEMVTWYDAIDFCNRLSELEGLTPVYTITNRAPTAGNPITNATVTANLANNGYRLPTEAQWEFAAKGRGLENFTFSGSNVIGDVAWFWTNSGQRTHEVGRKDPNGLGLYDMSGNVWEWCWDILDVYTSNVKTDPTGPTSGTQRVHRGGIFKDDAFNNRSVARNGTGVPSLQSDGLGFRVVLPQ